MLLIQRREFLGLMAAAGAARTRVRLSLAPSVRFFIEGGSEDLERGATMAIEEAERAAELFGGSVGTGDGPGLRVAIGRVPRDVVHDVYMNALDTSAGARRDCRRQVFHVAPREGFLAWSPGLSRFGADTLNKRYRTRYGTGMSSPAWCSWFAVKCAWEAALKSGATDGRELVEYLQSSRARFDGHKGVALYFDGANQLRQPVYDSAGATLPETPPEAACARK